MNNSNSRCFWSSIFTFLACAIAASTSAQSVPDATLPVNSTVTTNDDILTIEGGTRAGSNLFHSFQEFSVPTDTAAFFNNPLSIENIITRVTGGNVSNIDGIIRANGNANLFLLNPNGIIFGSNARLDIGGSFVGTTAESVVFADGIKFSPTNPSSTPLLTIDVPVGLQLGSNPGTIVVQGTGHTARFTFFTDVSGLNPDSYNLKVKPGNTLALIGGNLSLEGGLLLASGGRIELGSVTHGSAILNSHPQGFALSYPATNRFGNIQIDQKALADVSGFTAGSVQMQGQQVNIESGSLVLVQNQGNQSAGNITVNAIESLHISGIAPDLSNPSSVISETRSTGAAGNITLTSPLIQIQNGGVVRNRTFSNGRGGDIILNATNELNVSGQTGIGLFSGSSQIFATTHADGAGGNVSITSRNFSITNSGQVGARTYNLGPGGNLTVQADSILIVSPTPPPGGVYGVTTAPSLLSVSTFGSGNTGNLTINTRTLSVQNGGILSASTLDRGNAGTLRIDASESVEVKDRVSQQDTSYIGAAGLSFRGFGGDLRGDAGQVTIDTPVLKVSNDARIFVQNQGLGNAGTLRINADRIQLDTGGNISASTKVGEGGNINLQIADLLQMRRGSFISAEAGGRGNGGNITLNAPVMVSLENSDIIANAVQGNGGNIHITTQGIFRSSDSNITASSELGLSGTVNISNPNLEAKHIPIVVNNNFVTEAPVIASSCLNRRNGQQGRFVATGNGGLSETPDSLIIPYEVTQVRTVGSLLGRENQTSEINNSLLPNYFVREATGFTVSPDGSVILVTNLSQLEPTQNIICASN
ncbi:two-partner secretion domain-containing protein [Aerosakkonema funiforme]|uniref:Filamentous hemagglutinin N-terminal domain-containing protein n=1 Tax=Aerosakkonema funiforme FACHB-1375 TaxID=2949571 RepID=A0A926ZHQ3_9CYAN|nr:filamentous hemagglutinin N-terminal domain-containing protein [Aerosakkonema funiforme]MBD2182874.1 filamentous hemagglutinin N-terminal domain-containing protein [Aerosakkonema funiforme FACHB-1375]